MNPRSSFLLGAGLLLLTVFLPALRAEVPRDSKRSWPQWRGHHASGVSHEANLPAQWGRNSPNIKWRSPVPGIGASSPIVSNGRVFLTTAYSATRGAFANSAASLGLAGLLSILAVLVLVGMVKRRRQAAVTTRSLPIIDELLLELVTISFCILTFLVVLGPDYVEFFLSRVRRYLLSQRTGSLLMWSPGNFAAIWLMSGSLALWGAAASVGWFGRRPTWRGLGMFAILIVMATFVTLTPSVERGVQVALWKRLLFVVPGLALSIWLLVSSIRTAKGQVAAPTWRVDMRGPVLLAISAILFLKGNLLTPQSQLQRSVLCISADTGKVIWEQGVFWEPAGTKHHANTFATPTPCADGERVVADFGIGVVCLDLEGNVVWSQKDPWYAQSTVYGSAISPVITENVVILVRDREGPPGIKNYSAEATSSITGFSMKTGTRLWDIKRDYSRDNYGSPLLLSADSKTQLLTFSQGTLAAYDTDSGDPLWSDKRMKSRQIGASMVAAEDLLCAGGAVYPPGAFVMLRLGNDSGQWAKPTVLWEKRRGGPEISSPVIYNGKLFLVSRSGIMTCFDAKTGKQHWRTRLRKGKYYASLVAGDGKVYACSRSGVTTVVAAEPELRVIAENDLGEDTPASPAIANECILIRTRTELICIEKASNRNTQGTPARVDAAL